MDVAWNYRMAKSARLAPMVSTFGDLARTVRVLLVPSVLAACTVAIAGPPIYSPGAVEIPPGHMPPPGACRI